MKTLLRNITGIVALVLVIYIVSTYSGEVKEKVGVKGVDTSRAQEISNNISSDIGKQVDVAASRAGEVKVSEIVGFFYRFQKIPRDVSFAQEYATEQINNMLNSGNNK